MIGKPAPGAVSRPQSVLSGSYLESSTIDSAEALAARVPNATTPAAPEPHSPFYIVRGIGNGAGIGDPTVALYLDDVPLGELRSLSYRLLDVDEARFYRGPQGTHFGRNAEIGVLEVRTVRPANEWQGHGEGRYGNYNAQYAEGSVAGPLLKEALHLRLSGVHDKRGGYRKNTLKGTHPDDRESLESRLQLYARPLDNLDIMALGQIRADDNGSEDYVSLLQSDPFKVQHDVPGKQRVNQLLGALRIQYRAPGFDVLSVTARQRHELDDVNTELDLTPRPFLVLLDEYENTQWTQEFRLESNEDGAALRWRAGAFFEDRHTRTRVGLRFIDQAFIQSPPPGGLGLPFTAPVTQSQDSNQYYRTGAAFGEVRYRPAQAWTFESGLRLERVQREIHRTLVFQAPIENAALAIAPPIDEALADYAVLPRVALEFSPAGGPEFFASATRGWRPGGFSRAASLPAEAPWDPEFLWQFEAGLRHACCDGKVHLALTGFIIDVRDFLVRRTVTPPSFSLVNATRAVSQGVELEARAEPLKGLELQANGGWNDARFREFVDPFTGVDFGGNRLPLTPLYTFTLAARYRHPAGFFAWAEWQGRGDMCFLEDNLKEQGAYELLNARLGIEKEHWSFFVYGQNLLNRQYHHFAVPAVGAPGYIGTHGPPQTFGAGATFKW
ncbi:MAG: TonB-dependent receptor [Planctomycetota bacterium]|nr:TonB-dependent receptor [Planctomycetota bacterium]